MGTRHQIIIINKKKERKISLYGQFDGYPSGQGVGILNHLSKMDLKAFQTELDKIKIGKQDRIKELEQLGNWQITHPYLSRSCGSDIMEYIISNSVEFTIFIDDKEASDWCEGFYTIDFSKNTFKVEYYDIIKEYNLDKLPTESDFLLDIQTEED